MPDGSLAPLLHQPDIFNTDAYQRLHRDAFPGPAIRHVTPLGAFHAVQREPRVFASPVRAPYGGFDLQEAATAAEREVFIHAAETKLRKAGAQAIELAPPPLCHAPASGARALATLCRRGYVVTRQELNQSITIDGRPFSAIGAYATRKRLQKAARLGVSAHRLGAADHQAAHAAIVDNRRKKGRVMSMSWPDLAAMIAAFPDRMHLFGATQCGAMIAAAICVAVNPRILYVHAWGERAGAEAASPVATLAQCIHGFATEQAFELLDLGASSAQGVIDPGLHAFKRSLGAEPSLKLWLRKDLA